MEPLQQVTVVRVETAPGEEAQVDFGYAGTLYDPASQVLCKAWVFVMTPIALRAPSVLPAAPIRRGAEIHPTRSTNRDNTLRQRTEQLRKGMCRLIA